MIGLLIMFGIACVYGLLLALGVQRDWKWVYGGLGTNGTGPEVKPKKPNMQGGPR